MQLKHNNLLNPAFTYSSVWILVILLMRLKVTTNITELNGEPLWMIIIGLITSLYIYLIFRLSTQNYSLISEYQFKEQLLFAIKNSKYYLYILLFLTLLDFIFSNGFPLLWLVFGGAGDYTNVGIPSIRGFQYTLFLYSFTIYALADKYRIATNRIIIIKRVMIIFPILMLSRSLAMYMIFQYVCATNFWSRVKVWYVVKFVLLSVIIILIFGLIGDLRGEYSNPFSGLINDNYQELMDFLPSGFTWVYVYITANFNNIALTMGTFEITYSFGDILYNLVPSAIKNLIFDGSQGSPLITDASLNVASFYANYVTGFGIYGGVLGAALLQLIATYYYFKAKRGNLGFLLSYSILYSCILISVFFDALLTISTCFQLLLSLKLANTLKKLHK